MTSRTHRYGFVLLVFTYLVISCEGKKDQKTTDSGSYQQQVDTIRVVDIRRRLNASEALGDYKSVFLKTDSLLIGKISKLLVADSKIFIADKSRDRVFVFDMEGDMLFHINRFGNGPEEYANMKDVGVNLDEGVIEILDGASRKVVQYDIYSGKFVGSKSYDFWPRLFSPLSGGSRLFYIGHANQEPFKPDSVQAEVYITDSLNRIVKVDLPHKASGLSKIYLMTRQNIYQRGEGGVLLVPMYNNHIYGVENDRLKLQYYLDFGEKAIPRDFVLNFNRNPNDFGKYFDDSGYASYIYDFFESSGHVTFRFMAEGGHYRVIHDRSTGMAIAYRFWSNDEYRLNIQPIGVSGDYHLSKVPFESLKDRKGFYDLNVPRDSLGNYPEYQFLKEMVEHNESENPVLIFSKFKRIE
ncbi:MAG: 6-bladed beta-propeller [Roseivirga sp.]|nr:6-bladed beta-propeller [Roseivirga sp.]